MSSIRSSSDEKPFLSDVEEDVEIYATNQEQLRRDSSARTTAKAFIFHALLICIYTSITCAIILTRRGGSGDPVPTPAREGTEYHINSFNVEDNPYQGQFTGNPGTQVDENWNHLLRATNIRVSESDLKAVNRTSIQLADGSGDYWASMNVHHHLHCLMMIRHYIAIDHYPHDAKLNKFNLSPGRVYPHHIEHCIEGLRLWLICQPDTHLLTYNWEDEDSVVPDKDHAVTHQCVDWEKLEGWAFDRSFELRDGIVRYPDGRPFPP